MGKQHKAELPQGGALYVQFTQVGIGQEGIRKWSRHPFPGAIRFDATGLVGPEAEPKEWR